MNLHPILRRVGDQSHLFHVVKLDSLTGCSGIRWGFREGHGSGAVDFLQISRALVLDISDFHCHREQRVSFAIEDAPVLEIALQTQRLQPVVL